MKSSLLSSIAHIKHDFGTAGEPIGREFLPEWSDKKPIWKQVHGNAFAWVNSSGQNCGEVDALLSRSVNTPIAVVTADCVPILISRRDGEIIAAIHAGWRGTLARIIDRVWSELESQGEKASQYVAAIGPCISAENYEVSVDLITQFQSEFREIPEKIFHPSHRKLDLGALNQEVLQRIGFGAVENLSLCTFSAQEPESKKQAFFSYRRLPAEGRQLSMIERK